MLEMLQRGVQALRPVPGVPGPLRPLLTAYALTAGAPIAALLELLHASCRFQIDRPDLLHDGSPHIGAFWHRDIFSYLPAIHRDGVPRASLWHPVWTLSPWLFYGGIWGWEVVPGSTGHRGRAAADELVSRIRAGRSTFVCPDGPYGPPRVLKLGVLRMAEASGVPILPIRFEPVPFVNLGDWDGKRLPLPRSTIRVSCGEPIRVTAATFEDDRLRLTAALG